jgi:predicted phosphate transport protein (TIGR00153 family)
MAFKLKPKDNKFFEYLSEITEQIEAAAMILQEAVSEPGKAEACLKKIEEIEEQTDKTVAKIRGKLHDTFITPIDREDIYALAHKLDDLVDGIEGTIERMMLYNVGPASDGTKELVDLVYKSAKQLRKSCGYLDDIKKSRLKIGARCDRIVELEAEGDHLYRKEMAKLFRECSDPVEIIKWKDILMELEDLLDTYEAVADMIKGVVMKYA